MAKVASLFERFGIESPEEIKKRRDAEMRNFMSQYQGMGAVGASLGQGLRSLFSGPDEEMDKAQKFEDLTAASMAIGYDPLDPSSQYLEKQMLALGPQYAKAFDEMRNAEEARIAEQQAADLAYEQSMYKSLPTAVTRYVEDKTTGEMIPYTMYENALHKWDEDKGWTLVGDEQPVQQPQGNTASAEEEPEAMLPPSPVFKPTEEVPNPNVMVEQAGSYTPESMQPSMWNSLTGALSDWMNSPSEGVTPSSSGNMRRAQRAKLAENAPVEVPAPKAEREQVVKFGNRPYTVSQLKREMPDVYARYVEEGRITP